MFLPVLLIHDFGPIGWLVFAVPNVIGAAAMGWIIRNQEQSRRMVQNHRFACVMFSVVTILFHLYFVGWVIAQLATLPIALITIILAAGMWLLLRTDRRSVRIAIIIYVLSLLAFGVTIALIGPPVWDLAQTATAFSNRGVFWLFPACCLGFLTCPYLDLTFHRARQSTSRDGAKVAFGIGFGVFFLLMILFTLWYAGVIYDRIFADGANTILTWIVAGHMIIQSAFTIAAHGREIFPAKLHQHKIAIAFGVIALILPILTALVLQYTPTFGKTGYLLFMAFYALVAPAYVCTMMGTARKIWPPVIVAVVVAAPMYWLGFIDGRTIWLLPGVVIVLGIALGAKYFSPHPNPPSEYQGTG